MEQIRRQSGFEGDWGGGSTFSSMEAMLALMPQVLEDVSQMFVRTVFMLGTWEEGARDGLQDPQKRRKARCRTRHESRVPRGNSYAYI